jgi:hypothetical protein
VLVADGRHSEDSGSRKNGDGHQRALFRRTPSWTVTV